MIKPGCPSAAPADVMVTRSAVAVPSCGAGNATKPTVVSMSPSMSMAGGLGGSPTGTGNPAQYTGAAANDRVSNVMAVVGLAVVGLMV
jgi:hypothetical protein